VAGYIDPFPMEPSQWPVAVMKAAGKGQALYVAFGIGRYYAMHNLVHARDRMASFIDRLLPKRQLVVQAPRCLEITVWRQQTPERTILHLANRTPLAHDMPRLHEIAPLNDIQIEFDSPYPSPRVTCRGAKPDWAAEDGTVRVRIDRLNVYAALLVEPA